MASKQETKDIAIAQVKAVRLLSIQRSDKIAVYLGLVEGFAKSPFFNDEDIKDLDKLLDEAIKVYKERVRRSPKVISL